MATNGLVSFTNKETFDIRIVTAEGASKIPDSGVWFEPELTLVTQPTIIPGESFQSFLRRRQKLDVTYRCPRCKSASAKFDNEMSLKEFQQQYRVLLEKGLNVRES